MTLPIGDWDMGTFDADVETIFASPPFTINEPLGSIVSPGVWEFDPTGASGFGITIGAEMTTTATGIKIPNDLTGVPATALQAFVGTTWAIIVGIMTDGIYVTLDGSTFTRVYDVDMSDDFHDLFIVYDGPTTTANVYVDGALAYVLGDGNGFLNVGFDYDLWEWSWTANTTAQYKYMVVASTKIFPDDAEAIVANSNFSLGANGIEFTIDEYAHYNTQLSTALALEHYRIGIAEPV